MPAGNDNNNRNDIIHNHNQKDHQPHDDLHKAATTTTTTTTNFLVVKDKDNNNNNNNNNNNDSDNVNDNHNGNKEDLRNNNTPADAAEEEETTTILLPGASATTTTTTITPSSPPAAEYYASNNDSSDSNSNDNSSIRQDDDANEDTSIVMLQAYVPVSDEERHRRSQESAAAASNQRKTPSLLVLGQVILAEDEDHADSKNKKDREEEEQRRQNRRMVLWLIAAIVITIIVSLALGIYYGTTDNQRSLDPQTPTAAPTTAVFVPLDPLSILEPLLMQTMMGEDAFTLSSPLKNESTPEYRALQWLIHEDPRRLLFLEGDEDISLQRDEWRIVQRFVAALLFYATGGGSRGGGGDGDDDDPHRSWISNLNFTSSLHECDWNLLRPRTGQQGTRMGIQCDDDNEDDNEDAITTGRRRIVSIRIAENNMIHSIPSVLGLLTTHLRTIDFLGNDLTGTIPSTLGQLSELDTMDLSNNRLTGTLPEMLLLSWSKAKIIGLADNQFSGPIPTGLGALADLAQLRLHLNALSGTLPTELGQLTQLRALLLAGNQLTGTLPSEYGRLSQMTLFDISANQMMPDSTIPSEYAANWARFDDQWFLSYAVTPAPTERPAPTPPPTISLAPSMSPLPTSGEDCSMDIQAKAVCPAIPIATNLSENCRKQPFRMLYRLDLRRCDESIIQNLGEPDEGDFPAMECFDFDFLDENDVVNQEDTLRDGTYYVVASADPEGYFVYDEGPILSFPGRLNITDPASIAVADRLYLALYEYHFPTLTRGRIVQRVSIPTACREGDDDTMSILDIFGSFQLIEYESTVQTVQSYSIVDEDIVRFFVDIDVQFRNPDNYPIVALSSASLILMPVSFPDLIPPQVLDLLVAPTAEEVEEGITFHTTTMTSTTTSSTSSAGVTTTNTTTPYYLSYSFRSEVFLESDWEFLATVTIIGQQQAGEDGVTNTMDDDCVDVVQIPVICSIVNY